LVILVYLARFGLLYQEKSGNPGGSNTAAFFFRNKKIPFSNYERSGVAHDKVTMGQNFFSKKFEEEVGGGWGS
jgi:hypothetical protein